MHPDRTWVVFEPAMHSHMQQKQRLDSVCKRVESSHVWLMIID
jgi:hypothetical protein